MTPTTIIISISVKPRAQCGAACDRVPDPKTAMAFPFLANGMVCRQCATINASRLEVSLAEQTFRQARDSPGRGNHQAVPQLTPGGTAGAKKGRRCLRYSDPWFCRYAPVRCSPARP